MHNTSTGGLREGRRTKALGWEAQKGGGGGRCIPSLSIGILYSFLTGELLLLFCQFSSERLYALSLSLSLSCAFEPRVRAWLRACVCVCVCVGPFAVFSCMPEVIFYFTTPNPHLRVLTRASLVCHGCRWSFRKTSQEWVELCRKAHGSRCTSFQIIL